MLDDIVANEKRTGHGDFGDKVAHWKIHMKHNKGPSKARANTGIKVTQWNYACVRSTWIHNKKTLAWTKIGDREPIDVCEDLDELSKFLIDPGNTNISVEIVEDNKILYFKLKNGRNLDRKTLNLIRNKEISAIIN